MDKLLNIETSDIKKKVTIQNANTGNIEKLDETSIIDISDESKKLGKLAKKMFQEKMSSVQNERHYELVDLYKDSLKNDTNNSSEQKQILKEIFNNYMTDPSNETSNFNMGLFYIGYYSKESDSFMKISEYFNKSLDISDKYEEDMIKFFSKTFAKLTKIIQQGNYEGNMLYKDISSCFQKLFTKYLTKYYKPSNEQEKTSIDNYLNTLK